MNQQAERIISLLAKRVSSPLSEEEERELRSWAEGDPEREQLLRRLADPSELGKWYRRRALVETSRPLSEMEARLFGRQRQRRRHALAWGGAAAAVAAITFLIWPAITHTDSPHTAQTAQTPKALQIDSIGPGQTLAYLSDGSLTIEAGNINTFTGTPVAELKKQVADSRKPLNIEVPRGGEFLVILEDSTKVWLNSSSTLIYPENFTADSRRVSVKGEAYFSVTKDAGSRPFFVECDGQEIQVYGTEFNVRSYPEDNAVYTSLASGSVALRKHGDAGGELFLSPGKQAVFDKNSLSASIRPVDIETVTGWRKGRFVFQDQTLFQIMSDLARWYDFEFEFADPSLKDMELMGSIPRYGDFSTACLILEKTGGIKITTDGQKVIISAPGT